MKILSQSTLQISFDLIFQLTAGWYIRSLDGRIYIYFKYYIILYYVK
jgi:hypothetical protein